VRSTYPALTASIAAGDGSRVPLPPGGWCEAGPFAGDVTVETASTAGMDLVALDLRGRVSWQFGRADDRPVQSTLVTLQAMHPALLRLLRTVFVVAWSMALHACMRRWDKLGRDARMFAGGENRQLDRTRCCGNLIPLVGRVGYIG
jgi:hypothetical protein